MFLKRFEQVLLEPLLFSFKRENSSRKMNVKANPFIKASILNEGSRGDFILSHIQSFVMCFFGGDHPAAPFGERGLAILTLHSFFFSHIMAAPWLKSCSWLAKWAVPKHKRLNLSSAVKKIYRLSSRGTSRCLQK